MADVIIDGEVDYCLPDCTCCTACHKLIYEVEECRKRLFERDAMIEKELRENKYIMVD